MYAHSCDSWEEEKIAMSAETIAIIGAGSIGTAWAMVFALSGQSVALYDRDQLREAAAHAEILQRLTDMARIMGLPEDIETIAGRIGFHNRLDEAVAGASVVIECITEEMDAKRKLLSQLESLVGPDTIIASSSSFIAARSMECACRLARP